MTKRIFIPGDEWLYYKFYCGVKTANTILLNVIDPAINKLISNKLVENWFFVRFSDPEPHLRVRLKILKSESTGYVIRKLNFEIMNLVDEGVIWRVVLDSYVRELERYGYVTIGFVEEIFCADSQLVLNLIKTKSNLEVYLWSILKSIDNLLDLFEFNVDRKKNYYNYFANSYNEEFNVKKSWISKVKKTYINKGLRPLHFTNSNPSHDYQIVLSAIQRRDAAITPIVKHILEIERSGKLEVSITLFIQSCVHMFYNKAFENYQRKAELIGYNLGNIKNI